MVCITDVSAIQTMLVLVQVRSEIAASEPEMPEQPSTSLEGTARGRSDRWDSATSAATSRADHTAARSDTADGDCSLADLEPFEMLQRSTSTCSAAKPETCTPQPVPSTARSASDLKDLGSGSARSLKLGSERDLLLSGHTASPPALRSDSARMGHGCASAAAPGGGRPHGAHSLWADPAAGQRRRISRQKSSSACTSDVEPVSLETFSQPGMAVSPSKASHLASMAQSSHLPDLLPLHSKRLVHL